MRGDGDTDGGIDGNIAARLDPALRHLAEARTNLSAGSLAAVRQSLNDRRRATSASVDHVGVEVADAAMPAGPGRDAVNVRVYRGAPSPSPAVVYCHSGGFALGNLDTDHRQCVELARRGACTVISVDYRLAPEHRYPAALEDALAVVRWVAAEAVPLGVDRSRLAVAGSSAGASLAARLAQCAASGLAPDLVFQLLHQPVLDDRPTPSRRRFLTTPGFDGFAAQQMWRHLVGEAAPAGAVPARAEQLVGVAPALITCSELDPLRDEAIDYARRLLDADVATELHLFPGTCHGFDSLIPEWEISHRLFEMQGAGLRRALAAR